MNFADLNIQSQSLQKLPKEKIQRFPHLKALNASNNNISSIDDELQECIFLEKLFLESNHIALIDGLNKLKNLRILNVSNNEIHIIHENQLKSLPNLRLLDISRNKLTFLPSFEQNPFLESLNTSHNQLKQIPDLSLNTKMTSLDLSFNKIYSMASIERLLPKTIKKLSFSDNQLDSFLYLKELAQFKTLENVNVSENPFHKTLKYHKVNYRPYMLFLIPTLCILDDATINEHDQKQCEKLRVGNGLDRLIKEGLEASIISYLQPVIPDGLSYLDGYKERQKAKLQGVDTKYQPAPYRTKPPHTPTSLQQRKSIDHSPSYVQQYHASISQNYVDTRSPSARVSDPVPSAFQTKPLINSSIEESTTPKLTLPIDRLKEVQDPSVNLSNTNGFKTTQSPLFRSSGFHATKADESLLQKDFEKMQVQIREMRKLFKLIIKREHELKKNQPPNHHVIAAKIIQRHWRRYKERTHPLRLKVLQLERELAFERKKRKEQEYKLQSLMDFFQSAFPRFRNNLSDQYFSRTFYQKEREDAALKIQRVWRGYLCRSEYHSLKSQYDVYKNLVNSEAGRIQSAWKRYQEQKKDKNFKPTRKRI